MLGGQWLRTTGCTGHGAKGEGLLGWPKVPKEAGRSVHMGRLKEGKKEQRLLGGGGADRNHRVCRVGEAHRLGQSRTCQFSPVQYNSLLSTTSFCNTIVSNSHTQ